MNAVSHPPSLPPTQAVILNLLLGHGELYGLELVAASGGRLKRGTVYVTLGRMEEKGFVISRLEDAPPGAGGLPRRVYQATPLGRRVAQLWTRVARTLALEAAQ